MKLKRLLKVEWEAIAGIVAAVIALVMHFLHLIEEDILLTIAVVLIALLFIRDLRKERQAERTDETLSKTESIARDIQTRLVPPDVILLGPRQLRTASERFAVQSRGEMIWFHVCLLMFKPQLLFDALLRPAIENPLVHSIAFVLDENQRAIWEAEVAPKISVCHGHEKVKEPHWTTINENVSVIISDVGSGDKPECLLSFWGEPFMASAVGRDVPRYIFHVQSQSELVGRLIDLVRAYRVLS